MKNTRDNLTWRMRLLLASVFFAGLASNDNVYSQEPELSYDLVGGDLTDPEDDGDPEFDEGYEAVFASSEEEGFGGGEFLQCLRQRARAW